MQPMIAHPRPPRAGRARLLRSLLGAAVLAASQAGLAGVAASAPSAGSDDAAAKREADTLVMATRQTFSLSPKLAIDADLRARLDALFGRFAEAQRPVYLRWVHEAGRPSRPDADPSAARRVLRARFYNELGLWRRRPSTPQHDAALRDAASNPAACRILTEVSSVLDVVAVVLQQVPPDRRDALLDGESAMLRHWGEPVDASSATTSGVSAGDDERRWARQLRAGQTVSAVAPMSPSLAAHLLSDPVQTVLAGDRCAERRWWLVSRLALAPAATDATWMAWKTSLAQEALDPGGETSPYPDPAGSPDYPDNARKLGVEGRVVVRANLDEGGRFVDGSVLSSNLYVETPTGPLEMPGLAALLEGASLARARQIANEQAGKPAAAPATAKQFDIAWKLQ